MDQRNRGKRQEPNPGLVAARLRHFPAPAPIDAETIPIGSTIRTPTGRLARVVGYRGYKRDSEDTRIRLVCRYVEPVNKRFDVVQLLPELAVVVMKGQG